ncbi:MAG: pterin-4a-carbinolamine dehydratase [Flavobacterium sp.]|jgi:pterin-4a-carbinolamine dehydratase
MFKKSIFIIASLFILQNSFSQVIRTKLPDTITNWKSANKVGFDISQISFVNWNAGGNNSISGLLKGNFKRDYSIDKLNWDNELIFRYGINKQEGQELRKTDDQLQINSTVSFRNDTISKWFYAGKFNFNTQFYDGYSYPNTDISISAPFAPAYFFLGIGAEYFNKKKQIRLYLSPLTYKTTLVLNQRLANEGAFGVDKAIYDESENIISYGKKSRTELGVLISSEWQTEIYKNIMFENRISLYSDYLNHFGNIDVNWQLQFEMTVNEHVKASIGTQLIYDDDIKTKKQVDNLQVISGPKIQLKQIMGIGIVYEFKKKTITTG